MLVPNQMIIAVFCQGEIVNPLTDPGLIKLADAVWQSCHACPETRVRLLVFGPHAHRDRWTGAEAFLLCLTSRPGPRPKNMAPEVRIIQHTTQLRDVIVMLYDLRRPGERILIMCERVVKDQVLVQVNRYFPERDRPGQRVEVEVSDFDPSAQRWLNRQVKQPFREWLDRLTYKYPSSYSVITRLTSWLKDQLASRIER